MALTRGVPERLLRSRAFNCKLSRLRRLVPESLRWIKIFVDHCRARSVTEADTRILGDSDDCDLPREFISAAHANRHGTWGSIMTFLANCTVCLGPGLDRLRSRQPRATCQASDA